MSADLGFNELPDLVWIGPNRSDSTHDESVGTSDRWLANLLPGVLQSSAFREGGLLVVTYDEGRTDAACCGRPAGGGRVMTVVASSLRSRGFTSTVQHHHYSLLRTIEDAWHLGHLGHADDRSTESLPEFFAPAGTPGVDTAGPDR